MKLIVDFRNFAEEPKKEAEGKESGKGRKNCKM
jgi:hypothetical protein